MVVLIAGTTHTGKTLLAQRLLKTHGYPYLSIDHLKMGLIRSGQTALTPEDDEALVAYLWPIVREIVKTAIENGQNLVIEGCYIPFAWKEDFSPEYLNAIRYTCLIMTPEYIASHWNDICAHASEIERRVDDSGLCRADLMRENTLNLEGCKAHGCDYILIDDAYTVELIL